MGQPAKADGFLYSQGSWVFAERSTRPRGSYCQTGHLTEALNSVLRVVRSQLL